MKAGALATALLVGLALLAPRTTDEVRESATDALMRAVPRPQLEAAPVLAVAITEADLARHGPWPWPRVRVAGLVSALTEAGAAAIAIDIALVTPGVAEEDAELSAALGRTQAVLAMFGGDGPTPPGFGFAALGTPDLARVMRLPGAEPPAVAGAPAALAVLPGRVMRAAPMLARIGEGTETEGLVPGLALAALARAVRAETILLRPDTLQLGPIALDLPVDGMLRLHPARAPIPTVAAGLVLDGGVGTAVRGRVAVIGVSAPEAAPLRPSVFGPFTPSLRVQAEAVAQLADGFVPRRIPGHRFAEAAIALLLGLAAAFTVRRRPFPGLVLAVVIALRAGHLVDPALPAGAVLLAGFVQAGAEARRLVRERAALLARFAQRLPTGVAARLLAMPEEDRLRPERRRVAVVMTDLAGFSAMVRRGDPAAVVATLNAYLGGVERAVIDRGGTLERLIGDSVLAVFGAPLAQEDDDRRALDAARAIDAFAEEFRSRPEALALGWGETRIGVTAGEVMVGEIGGSRLTWSVCGDAANAAARLQELGKQVGRRVLVAGIEDPSLEPLGHFALRGVAEDVAVFGLWSDQPSR